MHPERLKQLQDRIAGGDEAALKALHEFFARSLFKGALTITRSVPASEEIVNDVFLKLWMQRRQLPAIEHLNAYLFTVTRNASLDYLRKISGRQFYDIDDAEIPVLIINRSPEDMMISSEIIHKINQEISRLPPRCRLIFKLVKIDGLKYREVAGLLDLDIKTVETQMSIALKKLHHAIRLFLPDHFRQTKP